MMIKKVHGSWFMVHSILFLLFTVYHLPFVVCYAQPISSAELISNTKQYDGKTVVYAGEVIGEIMIRGEYAWININDGKAAIGIWIDKNLTRDLRYTGNYKSRGDRVEIVGVFHRACLKHGGDLDIHAQGLRKIETGRMFQERLDIGKRNLVFVLLGILCLIWISIRLKIK